MSTILAYLLTVSSFTHTLQSVVLIVLSVYYYLYTRVTAKRADEKKIWVPPKPKPSLPFGLGPAPEPIKIEDFEATTYKDYETKLLKEGVQAVATSGGISFLMSLKFSPMALLIQSIMIPITLSENLVLKKYLLGVTQSAEGGKLYNELDAPPTAALVASLNAANAAATATADPVASAIGADEPRVEELPADKDDKKKKEKKSDEKKEEKKPKATSANEID